MAAPTPELLRDFPGLTWFERTSEPTWKYNCHAWGATQDHVWWEPARERAHPLWPLCRIYWPEGLPRGDRSLGNYRAAHATLGFEVCADGSLELGFEKIAHYLKDGSVSHTARQLVSGTWTSKLGANMDIEHLSPEELEGPLYGAVGGFMRRPRPLV